MYRGYFALFILATGLITTFGCSSGNGITAPDPTGQVTPQRPYASQALLGLYTLEIDASSGEVDVVPLRGPDFQINVVKFLQPPSGNPANLGVILNPDGTDVSKGIFDLDILITHPFPGTNMRGFDVRGIVMGDKGTQLSDFDYDVQYPKPTELRLLNPDGYTRWWNATEFLTPGLFGYTPTIMGSGNPKATVNGFKYFADDLAADDPFLLDPETRGTFSTQTPSGDPNTLSRNFVIQFPLVGGVPQMKFRYAICASFSPPEPGTTPPAPIEAFGLEANCPEAYQLSVSMLPSSTAYWTSTGSGGDLLLQIEIADWQAAENPDGLPGEIGLVRLESPTLWTGLKDPIASGTPVAATIPNASAWQVEIENVTPMDEYQDIFLTVQSADPTTYEPPIPGGGIYPGGAVLSAYQLYTVKMPGNSAPEIGDIYGPLKYVEGVTLTYTLTSMTDIQDGPNLTVKWDFNDDGIFEDDEDGSDTNKKGTYTFIGDTTFYVKCRVYDTAQAYTESNELAVEPMSLPFIDPMDGTTEALWTVQNGLFGIHSASLQWQVSGDHWSTGDGSAYQDYMDTALVSPIIPTGLEDTVTVIISHRYVSESGYDTCTVYYRKNSGSWIALSPMWSGTSSGFPSYQDTMLEITGVTDGDYIELAFNFNTDSSVYYYGWDITNLMVMDNKPPVIEGIYGPSSVDSLGPWTYTTVATDMDGIASYMWSVEPDGSTPVYDDPGDGMSSIDVTFPADGKFDIAVQVTDAGDPPLQDSFGPFDVTVFFTIADAFYSEHFDLDNPDWTYTGGSGDGAPQDFWHFEIPSSFITNVGIDGCYAETLVTPTEKTASVDITIPVDTDELRLRFLHRLGTESGGGSLPYDGQWVTLDGDVLQATYGFLTTDDFGAWPHQYFVGYTDAFETSTFILGTGYSDGGTHTLTLHSLSIDTYTNCGEGWDIDLIEMWFAE